MGGGIRQRRSQRLVKCWVSVIGCHESRRPIRIASIVFIMRSSLTDRISLPSVCFYSSGYRPVIDAAGHRSLQ